MKQIRFSPLPAIGCSAPPLSASPAVPLRLAVVMIAAAVILLSAIFTSHSTTPSPAKRLALSDAVLFPKDEARHVAVTTGVER